MPVIESRTVAQLMASRPAGKSKPLSSGLSPDEERAVMQESLDRHYMNLLDEPVPMLGNMSPRKAAKTKKGREKLVAWLKFIDDSNAQQEAHSPLAASGLGWMWEELGVAGLRR